MTFAEMTIAHRLRQVRRLWASDGPAAMGARIRQRAALALVPPGSQALPVSREHFQAAAEAARNGYRYPAPVDRPPDGKLTIAWVLTPPGPGSGGHTTIFRVVAALEAAGHTCVLYLHDRHGWSLEQHRETIRSWWPWMHAEVRDCSLGIGDSHAIFATSWETAYVLLGSTARGARCYFVQDFEPAFSPAGSVSLLAEATYRFGFHGVTAGRWLAHLLQRDYGMAAEAFDFGCDLSSYRLQEDEPAGSRAGICYYCRPSTPRRAHELAVVALELFAQSHPDVPIHVFGEASGPLPFRAEHHGLLAPAELSGLYNRCVAGLVLSATNVSLVPHEMLAAGCIPVVNEAEQNRMVLDNEQVCYAAASPFELSEALSHTVSRPLDERVSRARAAATSVGSTTWSDAGSEVEQILERLVTVSRALR